MTNDTGTSETKSGLPGTPPASLKRNMKIVGTLLITLSGITPATSVFIIAPGVMQQAGTGAFLSFLGAAVVGIFMALVYAELSSAFPYTGGEYAIVGRILGPFAGFVVLGLNFITFPLMYATLSLGISVYLHPLFPDVSPITAGLVTVAITTLFGILNIRLNAIITGIFLIMEMVVLAVLSYLGFANSQRDLSDFVFNPVHLGMGDTLQPSSLGLIGLAMAVAIWAYNGYGQAVYFGEETHNAPKTIARVVLLALLITIVAEAIPVTAILLGAPDLKALLSSENMVPDFIMSVAGAKLAAIISLGIALAIFNALIAMVLMCSRQFFSSGRDRVWPAFINRELTRIHKRFHSPWVATLLFGLLGAATCLINQNLLFVIIGTSLIAIYAALCLAVIVGRRKGTTAHGRYRMPLYPLPPIAGIVSLGYVIYANYLDKTIGRPSLLATLAMIIVSAFYYVILRRRQGGWKLHDPTNDITPSVDRALV